MWMGLAGEDTKTNEIEKFLEDQTVPSNIKNALQKQIEHIRCPSSEDWPAVRNALTCSNRPMIITRKEAEEALSKFVSEELSCVEVFLQDHAKQSHWPIDAVAVALLDVTLNVYDSVMSRLRNIEELEPRQQLIERQQARLRLMDRLFRWQPDEESYSVGTLEFWKELVAAFTRWGGHKQDEQEGILRDDEWSLAIELLKLQENPYPFAKEIDCYFSPAPANIDGKFDKKLARELPSILTPHTLARFSRPDGFASFDFKQCLNSERALLLDPEGPIWNEAAEDNAYKRLSAAGAETWALNNARQLILVFAALDEPEKLRPLTAKAKPLAAVWEVATAEHPTPQRQGELLRAREKFIGLEQPEDTLPLPPWAQQPAPQSR